MIHGRGDGTRVTCRGGIHCHRGTGDGHDGSISGVDDHGGGGAGVTGGGALPYGGGGAGLADGGAGGRHDGGIGGVDDHGGGGAGITGGGALPYGGGGAGGATRLGELRVIRACGLDHRCLGHSYCHGGCLLDCLGGGADGYLGLR